MRQHDVFSFAQDSASLVRWLRRSAFVHPFAQLLRVHARAAHEEELRPRKSFQQIFNPTSIDSRVIRRVTATCACRMDDNLKVARSRPDRVSRAQVNSADIELRLALRFDRSAPCPAFNGPAFTQKEFRGRSPEIPAAGDKNAAHNQLRRNRADFNFAKRIRLNRLNLFETDELKQGEKGHDYLNARSNFAEQLRKTHASAVGHTA